MKKIVTVVPIAALAGIGLLAAYLQDSPSFIGEHFESSESKSLVKPSSSLASQEGVVLSQSKTNDTKQIIKPVRYGDYQSVYGALPSSLEGAPLPTGLSVDSDGNLIPTIALQRLFDFFLTTVGEEPLEQVVDRIKEYLDFQLDEPALSQAKAILENYQSMKASIIEMENAWSEDIGMGAPRPDFQSIVERKRDIRREHLGEEVYQAFYEMDDQLDDYMLKKLDILKNDALSEEEKEQQLASIEALLPDNVQEKKSEQRQIDQLYEDIEQAKALGASEQEIYQMRLETLGAEKAERYQKAERVQQSWNARVLQYRKERNQIINSSLSEQDQAEQIELLRESHFEGRELMRIPVIDRMKDQEEAGNSQ